MDLKTDHDTDNSPQEVRCMNILVTLTVTNPPGADAVQGTKPIKKKLVQTSNKPDHSIHVVLQGDIIVGIYT